MAAHTRQFLPTFDFGQVLESEPGERMRQCVRRVRDGLSPLEPWGDFELPPVPDAGASEDELGELESQLGVALPAEYRGFLRSWRYLEIGTGLQVCGLPHNGVSIGAPRVWERQPGTRYLVFGSYWRYADGDQLLFDLSEENPPVVAYLHEHGPLFEWFAPSFSLALWRMVAE